jgi:hypothetical protein
MIPICLELRKPGYERSQPEHYSLLQKDTQFIGDRTLRILTKPGQDPRHLPVEGDAPAK